MRKRIDLFEDSGLKVDLSPMIDLVFLLLIFFMVTANMITFKKDPRVLVPVASAAQVPSRMEGRVVLNLLEDGSVVDTAGAVLSAQDVTGLMAGAKQNHPNARLHLRADARVPYKHIKAVSQSSAKGGVSTVIYSTHVVD